MDAALKAALFVGAVLLLGAGLFARWVGPELSSGPRRGRLYWGLGLGAALLVLAGLAELAATVQRALGIWDAEFFREYALYTRHGQATLARSVLAGLLLGLGLGTRLPRALDRALHALLGLALLASLSLVSHSGVMGTLPFLGDLAHLVGAALWAGALLFFAWVPDWQGNRAALARSIERVSSVGLFAVTLLALTGVYTATLHLYGPEALTRSSYGLALVVKVALVLVILAVAAANRWVFMPRLAQGQTTGLRRAVRLESLLLLAVLGATGVLATREPAHLHPEQHGGHGAADIIHDHGTPDPNAPPGVWQLATGPVTVTPLLEAGSFALVLTGAGLEAEGFVVVGPAGEPLSAAYVPAQDVALELRLVLPGAPSGRWELVGPSGEFWPFTVLGGGGDPTLFFMPTPSLAGAGSSEVFVYADAPEPLFLAYHMADMAHAGNGEVLELEPTPYDARARRASLSLPMVGDWDVTLLAGTEALATFRLEVVPEQGGPALHFHP